MIKVKCRDKEKSKEINYPCLMKSNNGDVALFDKEGYGVLLMSSVPGGGHKFEKYTNTWAMRDSIPYTGEIILSNGGNND